MLPKLSSEEFQESRTTVTCRIMAHAHCKFTCMAMYGLPSPLCVFLGLVHWLCVRQVQQDIGTSLPERWTGSLTQPRVKALTRSHNQGNVWAARKSLGTSLLVHSADSASGILRVNFEYRHVCESACMPVLPNKYLTYFRETQHTYHDVQKTTSSMYSSFSHNRYYQYKVVRTPEMKAALT